MICFEKYCVFGYILFRKQIILYLEESVAFIVNKKTENTNIIRTMWFWKLSLMRLHIIWTETLKIYQEALWTFREHESTEIIFSVIAIALTQLIWKWLWLLKGSISINQVLFNGFSDHRAIEPWQKRHSLDALTASQLVLLRQPRDSGTWLHGIQTPSAIWWLPML